MIAESYHTAAGAQSPRGWRDCKSVGDVGEALLIKALRRAGYQVLRQAEGEAAGFDLELSARVEVKTDMAAACTGNVAVELERRGEPSGLNTSVADLWAFVIGAEAYIVKTAKLRGLVDAPGVERKAAGDPQSRTVCAILPLEILRQHSRRIILREGQP